MRCWPAGTGCRGSERPGAAAAIRRFLDRLRTLLALAAAATALFHCLAVASVALVLNTLIVERLPGWPWVAFVAGRGRNARPGGRRGAPCCWRWRGLRAGTAARRVQAAEPDLRNDVESSLDLASLLAAPVAGISSPLVGALVASTGERLAARRPAAFCLLARGPRRGAAAGGRGGPAGWRSRSPAAFPGRRCGR